MNITRILFCADGEAHTRKAGDYALFLAKRSSAGLVALHVLDPYLKKFAHEIYAVSRDECRAHLDKALREEGEKALGDFSREAWEQGIMVQTKFRSGNTEEEILKEIGEGGYDLVIMGGKLLRNWKERFESFNLPRAIFDKSPVPVLFVR